MTTAHCMQYTRVPAVEVKRTNDRFVGVHYELKACMHVAAAADDGYIVLYYGSGCEKLVSCYYTRV